jgi:hypothetical protein
MRKIGTRLKKGDIVTINVPCDGRTVAKEYSLVKAVLVTDERELWEVHEVGNQLDRKEFWIRLPDVKEQT